MGAPNFFLRLLWLLPVLFRFLVDGRFAEQSLLAWKGATLTPNPASLPKPPEPAAIEPPRAIQPPAAPPPPPAPAAPDHSSAMRLLAVLQRDGRLVDFLLEDISSYGDADVGAAARVVHDGCKKSLDEYVTLEAIRTESEGSRVTLPAGFDAAAIRLTGQLTGQPPFAGTVRHHGWRATQVKLPAGDADASIIAPAEVEL